MKYTYLLITLLSAGLISFAGCDQKSLLTQYHEVILKPEKKNTPLSNDPHAFMQGMPQDDIHANLNIGDKQAMPQDDIHANLKFGDMPMQESSALEASVDRTPLLWQAPQGWIEEKGSGMRLATFKNSNAPFPVETTIISLGGSAGGLSANVVRWIQQLQIQVPDDAVLNAFLNRQEKLTTLSGLQASVINLTELQSQEPDSANSMIAAIIDRGQSQIFVKMTGSKSSVLANLNAFKDLVKSIAVNE